MDSKRITALRAIMKREGIDYYYIPTADFHESEYVVEYFKARKFITGFTGSAGVAVIGQEEAGFGQMDATLFRRQPRLKDQALAL